MSLSQAKRDEMIQLFQNGVSTENIAKQLNCGKATVYRNLAKAGLIQRTKLKKSDNGFTKLGEDEKIVCELYQSGVQSKEIAKRFSCDKLTIRNIIKRNGLKPRNRGGQKRIISDELANKILEMWKSGQSQWKIGQELHMHQTTISSILRRFKIEPELRTLSNSDHPFWQGGEHLNKMGYVEVLMSPSHPFYSMSHLSGYVLKHRLVMAEHLGRPLESYESVHHLDGCRTHNEVENLQLRIGKHGKNQRATCRKCGSHEIEFTDI